MGYALGQLNRQYLNLLKKKIERLQIGHLRDASFHFLSIFLFYR